MHDGPAAEQHPVRTRSVLLEHATPDGGSHLDWMIERPGAGDDPDEHRLITFRCRADPLAHAADARPTRPPWTGDRLPDHRAVYLDYEGPISGDRGSVRRLWSTACEVLEETDHRLRIKIRHPTSTRELGLDLSRRPSGAWAFSDTESGPS